MRSTIASLQELWLPAGAGSGSPRIGITRRMPADLIARYAPDTIVGGIVSYDASGRYHYDISVISATNSQVYTVRGYSDPSAPFIATLIGEVYDSTLHTASVQILNARIPSNSRLQIDLTAGFTIDGISAPRPYLGSTVSTAGTVATSAGGEVFVTPWDIQPTLNFQDQRIYRLDALVHVSGTVASLPYRVRVYDSLNLLLAFDGETTVTAATRRSQNAVGYCYNTSGGGISDTIRVSIQRTAGAGSVSLYGDSLTPLSVTCADVAAVGSSVGIAGRPV